MAKPLSPAAQAVLSEVMDRMTAGECDSYARWIAAAALRAAADHMHRGKSRLLAIAAELEGQDHG